MILIQIIIYWASYLVFPFILCLLFVLRGTGYKKLVYLFLCLSLLFVYARFVEPNIINIKEHNLSLNNNSTDNEVSIKVAVFSDMHIGLFRDAEFLEKQVEIINKQKPDLVLIPGDFIYKIREERIAIDLKSLEKISAPVYAVIGNHDYGFPGENSIEELEKELGKRRVKIIDDGIETVGVKGRAITLVGIGDLWFGYPNHSLLENMSIEDTVIVLAHNPDELYEIDDKEKIDLFVAGHTHGGQIRLPIIFRYIIPCEHAFDKGFETIEGVKTFVSPGTGMVGLPMRFLMVPEIDMLNIKL